MTENKELPILDLADQNAAIVELNKKANELIDGFVLLGIQYMNVVTHSFSSKDNAAYFALRDSISFRLNSLLYHFMLLLNIQRNQIERLNKAPFDSRERHMLMINSGEQQIYLFDSMIFHSTSLFDYLGNTVEFLCGGKKQSNLKWNGVVNSARDEQNKMSRCHVAPEIITVNSNFVERLYKHRSDIIHYKTDLSSAKSTFNIATANADYVVFGPRRFVVSFTELKSLRKANRLTLNYAANWLCNATIENAGKVLTKLFMDINEYKNR